MNNWIDECIGGEMNERMDELMNSHWNAMSATNAMNEWMENWINE